MDTFHCEVVVGQTAVPVVTEPAMNSMVGHDRIKVSFNPTVAGVYRIMAQVNGKIISGKAYMKEYIEDIRFSAEKSEVIFTAATKKVGLPEELGIQVSDFIICKLSALNSSVSCSYAGLKFCMSVFINYGAVMIIKENLLINTHLDILFAILISCD